MPPLFGITGSLPSHSLPSSRLAMRPQRARRLFSGSFLPTRRMDMTLAEGHCMRPQFNCTLWLWFDRGGIYVMANLRGGGEFGTEWHLNGNLTRKQNVCGWDLLSTRFHSSRSPPGRGLIFTGSARPRPRGTAPPAGLPPILPGGRPHADPSQARKTIGNQDK